MKKINNPTHLMEIMADINNTLYEELDGKAHKITRLFVMDMSFRKVIRMIRNEKLFYINSKK